MPRIDVSHMSLGDPNAVTEIKTSPRSILISVHRSESNEIYEQFDHNRVSNGTHQIASIWYRIASGCIAERVFAWPERHLKRRYFLLSGQRDALSLVSAIYYANLFPGSSATVRVDVNFRNGSWLRPPFPRFFQCRDNGSRPSGFTSFPPRKYLTSLLFAERYLMRVFCIIVLVMLTGKNVKR
ncbi:hypothetical protein GWI33_005421 [Rhynchophorus ferrugineus]|uniref:Uncharacterized protein n=1 Tax=Rhynchophorus ferrugineus TaxID=354439 RepID=A0A834MDU0_RHYFE|nr:hypothetical protein GWI33_005421 [Rhynchophorus ferrugineus]